MKKQLLILMTLFISVIGYSQTFTDSNFITYAVYPAGSNTVQVTDYDTSNGGTNVVIPATVNYNTVTYTVTSIAGYSFWGKSITSVKIPNTVTTIGALAFRINQLTSVTIPSSVTSIGNNAFTNNSDLSCVIAEGITPPTITPVGNNDSFGGRESIDLKIPNGSSSSIYAAAGWGGFQTTTYPILSGTTFQEGNITYKVLSPTLSYIVETSGYTGGSTVSIPSTVSNDCITYTVSQIGPNSFTNSNLSSVTIPNSITTIASSAFSNNNLSTVNIPNSVTTIGSGAFSNNNLSNITIPNSVTSIGSSAFADNNLTGVTFSDNITEINSATFSNNQLTSIDIPDGVTIIGSSAFYSNQLTSVDIPNSVTSIGSGAFSGNTSLSMANLSTNLISIGFGAFSGCSLTNVDIPNSVISIDESAFGNNAITTVSLSNSLMTIGDYAFGSNQISNVTIPASVTSMGEAVFRLNPLTSVTSLATIPASITTENGIDDTFVSGGDRSGIALYIPANTTDIYVTNPTIGADWSGFNPVTELLAVGDPLEEDYISYEVTSSALNTVQIIGYDVLGGLEVDIPATVTHNTITYDVTRIDNQAFQGKGLTDVTIPNSIIEIGEYAFFQNALSELVIPDSITSIELGIFESNLLTSITIPESITSIGISSFKNNPLNSVISKRTTPPTIVTSGPADSFGNNRSSINLVIPNATTDEYVTNSGALWTGFNIIHEVIPSTNTLKVTNYNSASGTNVSIPAAITDASVTYDVTEIGIGAFFDKGLTSVTIPNSITSIGNSAFNTNNLTSVTIPDSVIFIGSQAFVTNDLTSLSIGNSVTNIDFAAFLDNDLTDITIPSSVTTIGSIAFAANPLTDVTSLATIPPTITTGTNDTFDINGVRSNIHLHIPAGTMGAYVTNPGALWTGFNPVTQDALSVLDFELANNIKVVTTADGIKILSPDSVKLENYTIYSITGAKVATGAESEISTSFLANGIYVLKLGFDKGTVAKKFVNQ